MLLLCSVLLVALFSRARCLSWSILINSECFLAMFTEHFCHTHARTHAVWAKVTKPDALMLRKSDRTKYVETKTK